MKKVFWIFVCLAVVFLAFWFFIKPKAKIRASKIAPIEAMSSNFYTTNATNNANTNQLLVAVIDDAENSSIPSDIIVRYRNGIISKDEAVNEARKRELTQVHNFYGKITDQNGSAVEGVTVTGTIESLNALQNETQNETFQTLSDGEGLFEFTNKKGTPITVVLSKAGYLIGGQGEVYRGPAGENTTYYNRAILTIWKLRGGESLTSSGIDAKIPHDGTSTVFDIVTGKESANGDLRVTLIRSPLEVLRGRDKFDWTLKVEMRHGGLVKENDAYPYWAPETGYQPSFEFNVSSNNVPWRSQLEDKFYIKTSQGQFGKMQFGVYSALTPARLQVGFIINPSGSQNLEPAIQK